MARIEINYHDIVSTTNKATLVSFSLSEAISLINVEKHCGDNKKLLKFLMNHKIEIWIPHSVFYFIDYERLSIKKWFFKKIKDTPFISIKDCEKFNINQPTLETIVRIYLCKNY